MRKSVLRWSSAGLALSAALAAGQAGAQEGSAGEGGPIIVTAEKREQLLVDVAQSISVVSGETLENQHADTFGDYLKLVPGLQLDQDRQGQARLVIRGLNTGGVASTVGVYMDETPFGSSSGLVNAAVLAGDFDTFDLDRIEVLRGPQGTFYGASSLAGVLKFVTNEPSTARIEVRARAGVETTDGGDESYLGNLMVNVPLGEKTAFRASGSYRKYGGYIDSIGTAGSDVESNINNSESYNGRASLLFMPSETFDIKLTALAQDIRADAPSQAESDPETFEIFYDGLTLSQYVPSFSNLKYRVYNGTANLDLGFATLTSSSSFATQKQRLRTDYTNALAGLLQAIIGVENEFFQDQRTENEKFTQELRLSGESTTVDWLVGAYYTDEDGLIFQDFIAAEPGTTDPIPGLPLIGQARIDSSYEEIAAFANLTVHLGERFEIGIGGRYSENEQSAHQVTDGVLVGGVLTDLPVFTSDEEVFTYSVAPRFEISDDVSLYARVAKGFRPGGPNIIPVGAPAGIPTSYDSDSVVSYEAGLKGQSADGLVYFDVAAFRIDWDDIQLLVTDDASGFNFNGNGSSARSDGVEFTFTAQPMGGLDLSVNGAYTNARLTDDTDIGGVDGDRLPFTPKLSIAVLADYSFPLGGQAEGHVGGSLRHLSSQATGFNEDDPGDQRFINGYQVVDLSAGVDFGRINLDLYVRNLNNSKGRTSITGTDVFGGFPLFPNGARATGVLRPRTFGVTLGVEL